MITIQAVFATAKFNSINSTARCTDRKYLLGIEIISLDQNFSVHLGWYYLFLENDREKPAVIIRRKINHAQKNKTHKNLTGENLSGINAPVTEITVFETSEGIGERSREALGESKGRAVCSC
jgi:hypothetical protein